MKITKTKSNYNIESFTFEAPKKEDYEMEMRQVNDNPKQYMMVPKHPILFCDEVDK